MSLLTDKEQNTVRVYDSTAAAYAEAHRSYDFWKQELERFGQILPGGKVLEIGSGGGRDASLLVKAGYDYLGTDISAGLIEQAQMINPDVNFKQASVYQLSEHWQEEFDGFWAAAVLLHIPKSRIGQALQNIHTVLRNDGKGFISIKEGDGEAVESDGRFFAYWQRSEFEETLRSNGFRVLDFIHHPMSERTKWLCFFVEKVETGIIKDEVDNMEIPAIEPGIYEHYKGNRYEVIGVALHSETLEPVVVYRPLYETKAKLWVRQYDMFVGDVEIDGAIKPRFRHVAD